MSRIRIAGLLSGALVAASLATASAAQVRDAGFDEAVAQYEIGHYEAAFDRFAILADSGHCEAARIARQMSRHGKALYRLELRLEPERVRRWVHLPGCPAAVASR